MSHITVEKLKESIDHLLYHWDQALALIGGVPVKEGMHAVEIEAAAGLIEELHAHNAVNNRIPQAIMRLPLV